MVQSRLWALLWEDVAQVLRRASLLSVATDVRSAVSSNFICFSGFVPEVSSPTEMSSSLNRWVSHPRISRSGGLSGVGRSLSSIVLEASNQNFLRRIRPFEEFLGLPSC